MCTYVCMSIQMLKCALSVQMEDCVIVLGGTFHVIAHLLRRHAQFCKTLVGMCVRMVFVMVMACVCARKASLE